MTKYEVTVRFPIIGFEIHELEVVSSSEEEAEQKAIEFVQTGEGDEVTQIQQPYYEDLQTYCERGRSCEYDVQVDKIDEETE